MTKWILAGTAMLWLANNGLPLMENTALLGDCVMALAIAMVVQPWVVRQLEG